MLRRVDLGGEPAADAAERLGVTPGALRERFEAVCRACATTGCTDCTRT